MITWHRDAETGHHRFGRDCQTVNVSFRLYEINATVRGMCNCLMSCMERSNELLPLYHCENTLDHSILFERLYMRMVMLDMRAESGRYGVRYFAEGSVLA